jgi:hypothetical protein
MPSVVPKLSEPSEVWAASVALIAQKTAKQETIHAFRTRMIPSVLIGVCK